MKPADFRPMPRTEATLRRQADDRLGTRVAQLAWFELAAAATRRALAQQDLAAPDETLAAGD
jgi:hypothetical protein